MNNYLKMAITIPGIIIGLLILLFIILVIYYAFAGTADVCTTKECFLVATDSNQCPPTVYKEVTGIGTFNYVVSPTYGVTDKCTFTKQILDLNENEDPFLKKALKSKEMTCSYVPGEFNENWIDSLIDGTEDCSGELKDAIVKLLSLV
ncbi:MAG: hypothetical protein PHH82_01320 [Candidatus ainarchaeum sp.]|nr:hypothetical protein [Candidatus ainarchaeum sp.]